MNSNSQLEATSYLRSKDSDRYFLRSSLSVEYYKMMWVVHAYLIFGFEASVPGLALPRSLI